MNADEIVFDLWDEADGVTAIRGCYKLPDGRQAAALERIHGKEYVCPLHGAGYWVKLPQYDEIADKARSLITKYIVRLVESSPTTPPRGA